MRVQEWAARRGGRALPFEGLERIVRDENPKIANAWVKADRRDKGHVDELLKFESLKWKAWPSGHDAVSFGVTFDIRTVISLLTFHIGKATARQGAWAPVSGQ